MRLSLALLLNMETLTSAPRAAGHTASPSTGTCTHNLNMATPHPTPTHTQRAFLHLQQCREQLTSQGVICPQGLETAQPLALLGQLFGTSVSLHSKSSSTLNY